MSGLVQRCGIRDLLNTKEQLLKSSEATQPPPPTLPPAPRDEVDNIEYRFEEARLQSYKNWPVSYMEPAKLAKAGFYYTGEDDKVRCFECNISIGQWVENDDPESDHRKWSENCRLLRGVPCGNVPIGVNPVTIPPYQQRSFDICGNFGIELRPNAVPDVPRRSCLPSTAKLGSLGIGRPKGPPAHPEFASYDARLKTFDSWPKSLPQDKEQLTDAGFYYTGKGDQTCCYYCGGGLKDWEPDDDPWMQHAMWFAKCYYLLTVKGQEYINNVKGENSLRPSREEALQMELPNFIQKNVKSLETNAEAKSEECEESEAKPGPSSQSSIVKSCDSGYTGSMESLSSTSPPKSADGKPIDDARMCKICYNEELGVVFLPCSHMVACTKCAPGLMNCAVCREPVTMTVRAIFS